MMNEPIKYKKDFMKMRFESDDDLLLGKTFSIFDMIIVATSILEKNGKCYPQTFLHMNARLSYKSLATRKSIVSEGIDIDKRNESKERMLCHYLLL